MIPDSFHFEKLLFRWWETQCVMGSVLDSGRAFCNQVLFGVIVFLSKRLYFQSALLHPGVYMGISKANVGGWGRRIKRTGVVVRNFEIS